MNFFYPALRFYFKDRLNLAIYVIITVLQVASFIGAYWLLPTEDNIPLHYNIYFGIDFVGHSSLALLIPTATLILAILNTSVGIMLWRQDRIMGYFLSFGTLAVVLAGVIALGLTINIAR